MSATSIFIVDRVQCELATWVGCFLPAQCRNWSKWFQKLKAKISSQNVSRFHHVTTGNCVRSEARYAVEAKLYGLHIFRFLSSSALGRVQRYSLFPIKLVFHNLVKRFSAQAHRKMNVSISSMSYFATSCSILSYCVECTQGLSLTDYPRNQCWPHSQQFCWVMIIKRYFCWVMVIISSFKTCIYPVETQLSYVCWSEKIWKHQEGFLSASCRKRLWNLLSPSLWLDSKLQRQVYKRGFPPSKRENPHRFFVCSLNDILLFCLVVGKSWARATPPQNIRISATVPGWNLSCICSPFCVVLMQLEHLSSNFLKFQADFQPH